MANPRKKYSYERIHSNDTTYPGDASIVVPVIGANGWTPAMSPQVGLAVASVNAGQTGPMCGLGTAGAPLLGKVNQVETDGACSVQDEGYMYLPYVTGANIPVVGGPVGVDGTGNVQAVAAYSGAKCVGFGLNLSPVQPGQTSTTYCIVKI